MVVVQASHDHGSIPTNMIFYLQNSDATHARSSVDEYFSLDGTYYFFSLSMVQSSVLQASILLNCSSFFVHQ